MKKIAIFGSTGSIGKSLINIIKKDKKNFKIELLSANKNYKELIKQIKIFKTKNVIITDKKSFMIAKKILINKNINVYDNFNDLNKIFKNKKIDYTMSAISGFEGLRPTIDVIKFTKIIAIANKESIICGWNLIKKKLLKYKTKFIPIDSEHFSIWSLIGENKNINFEKIYLTASGGPFRTYPLNQFKSITPKEALKHPNWSMGKKISIDSATMMNKVFEIIEAKKIFDLEYNQLQILIHPQSYLHAIVKFNNGLTKFLVHDTNMTIPIFNSINFNNRKTLLSKPLNLNVLNNLSLENVNKSRFPLVKVIDKLTNSDSLFDTVVVCTNDLLVSKFLNGDIKFIDISKILLKILSLKEFTKYKKIRPKKIKDIQIISKLVSLKIASLGV
tara:strand:- start:2884 stop:4047 length:1164 start_codon:yes stop_codon:yes gene_type:complete